MKDEKPEKQQESPWVTVARYSEIGFMIPAAVFVGYLLGLGADHFLHTHWLYLVGILFGAIAGFVSMIRRALQASADEDKKEEDNRMADTDIPKNASPESARPGQCRELARIPGAAQTRQPTARRCPSDVAARRLADSAELASAEPSPHEMAAYRSTVRRVE